MYTAAGSPDPLGQPLLERRLPILVFQADVPFAPSMLLAERSQPGSDDLQVSRGKQLLGMQHLNMGKGGGHVISNQPLIERIIFAGRVLQHTAVERRALIPQTTHADCCSAGLSALTSATINVPVPSFVNTSPRIPSGDLYDTT